MRGNIVLYNEDCMPALAKMKDNEFDLAIVDPPYGIGADEAQNNAALSRIKAQGKSKAGRGWELYRETKWDKNIPNKDYFLQLLRISKNQIIWGGNYMTDFLPSSRGWVVWNKCQREFSLTGGS